MVRKISAAFGNRAVALGRGTEFGVAFVIGYPVDLGDGEKRLMAVTKWTVWVERRDQMARSNALNSSNSERDLSSHDPGDLGLRLADTKDLLHALQTHLVQDQVKQLSAIGRACSSCGSRRPLHDYRRRQVDTLSRCDGDPVHANTLSLGAHAN